MHDPRAIRIAVGFTLVLGSVATASQSPSADALRPRAAWLDAVERPAAHLSTDDFDWHLPPGKTVIFDTALTVLGPDDALGIGATVIVEGGILRVRNLHVPEGTILKVEGPNPLLILASGEVRVDGGIVVDGASADSVATLNQPTIPQQGATGHAGGGKGGTGSRLIDRSTPKGGPGSSAFNLDASGGQGGESGWHPSQLGWGAWRRAAGGGGGVFAADVLREDGCLDQSEIGLDAEDGFPGATTAFAAMRPGELMPWGGRRGRGPFANAIESDDFWGSMVIEEGLPGEHLIQGELPTPWAGAGGGGGGDATWTSSYPPPQFIPNREDVGAGGGGGAGALIIFARRDVILGPRGRLSANGGHGGGGENTNFVNRIGGGSGGGSGGHIIVQTLGKIDFTQVVLDHRAISARGGQGGEGNNGPGTPPSGSGGAGDGGETTPLLDAMHVGVSGPGDQGDNPWIPPESPTCIFGPGVVRAAGGDGGPGVIQLHVTALSDILPPAGDPTRLARAIAPPPVGFSGGQFFGRLLPTF